MLAVLALLYLQSLSQQGAQAMREQRFEDAERIYRQMLKENPRDSRLRMNLGLALHSSGKYRESIPELQAFLNANPDPGPIHLILGASHLKLRQPCEAIPPLEKARRWQATPQVLVELGDAYFGCKRYADAARTFEALGSTPKALQGAGLSYARLGRQQDAQQAFAKLEALPPSAELYELIAEVHTLESRNEEALKALTAALELAPGDTRIQRLRARALWRIGHYDEAERAYRTLVPRWSHDPEFNFELGDTLVRTQGPEAGLPYLQKAASLLSARGALGRALMQLGRAQESIVHLEAAAAQDPTLLLPLSRAYKAVGRAEDAARAEQQYKKQLGFQN